MILIVDDDCAVRMSIALMLTRAGYECVEASNEVDALRAVRTEGLQLVILDMNLTLTTTGRSGIELLRKIRVLAPDVPVIMLSAWATVPLTVEGMGYGAVDFVTKPWSNRDFMDRIRRALELARRRSEESGQVDTLDQAERKAVERALRAADGNIAEAARMLGLTRQSLYRRIEKLGL